jgi:hypothetical protein
MAYPQHWLLTFGGSLGTGRNPEIWQCGLRGKPSDGSGLTMGSDEETALDRLVPGLQAWWTNAANATNSDAKLEWVKLNEIGPDGHYVQSSTHVRAFAGIAGTAGSGVPSWLTVCFEWRTSKGRGPGSHGRIFPPLALPAGADDIIPAARQTLFLNSAKDLLKNVENPEGATTAFAPGVVSEKDGTFSPITHALVGDVIEFVSRRRNAVKPLYMSVTYP